jgi:hypothetical protein
MRKKHNYKTGNAKVRGGFKNRKISTASTGKRLTRSQRFD